MDAIGYLKAVATVEACRGGYEHVVERSNVSEATYVKLCRDSVWYGVRIAAHLPYYASSADYEQILVPLEVESVTKVAAAETDLVRAIHQGGRVVADPQETAVALLQALRAKRRGMLARGEHRSVWRWDENVLTWRLIRIGDRTATAEDEERLAEHQPGNAPDVRLTSAEQSAVRHRLNLRAEWSHEEALKFASASRRRTGREGPSCSIGFPAGTHELHCREPDRDDG